MNVKTPASPPGHDGPVALPSAQQRLDDRGRWMALLLASAVAVAIPLWGLADLFREGPELTVHFMGPRLLCSAVLLAVVLAIRARRGDPGVLTVLGLAVAQLDSGWMVPQTAHPEVSVLGTTLVLFACGAVLVVHWGWTLLLGICPVVGFQLASLTAGATLSHDQFVACTGVLLTTTVTAVLAHAVRHRGLVREVRLATELEAEQARTREMATEMSRLSRTDVLTGLANRRAWDDALQAVRGAPVALILVDVDHFKQVNDTDGHEAGDRALQQVADALAQSFRAEDLVARLGGDEFGVLLRGVPDDCAAIAAEAVRARVADLPGLPVTLSIGVAAAEADEVGVEDLLRTADARLYRAKATRNAVVGADAC